MIMPKTRSRVTNLVEKHGAPILFYVVILNVILLGWIYVDGNTRADKRQDVAIEDSKQQTEKIISALDKHTKLLNSNDQQLREYGEATLCVLAILRPDVVPSADPAKCRAKLGGINNTDGTFLSGTWPPLPPEQGSKELKQEEPKQKQTGFLGNIINQVQGLLP